MIQPSHRLDGMKTYYFADKLAEIQKLNADGKDIINLGIGSPDIPPHPKVIDTLKISADDAHQHGYQSYRGTVELRKAVAAWYWRHFDVLLDGESELLPLIGSKEGIMHISMSFINEGDQVLIPNPGYPTYRAATLLAGGEPIYYDLNNEQNWLPDIDSLETQDLSNVKIMWINYPHMPTGARGDLKQFQDLVSFASRHDILLCHDNPYHFILNENPYSIFQVEGAKEIALELTSMSKSYNMAGWRIGYVAGRKEYIDHILTFKSNMDSGMFLPAQKAAVEALNLDDQWVEDINQVYNERKSIAKKIFDLLNLDFQHPSAGLFLWGRHDTAMSSATLSDDILYKSRVFITPGHIFGSRGEGYLRLSLCTPKERLIEAYNRIKMYQS